MPPMTKMLPPVEIEPNAHARALADLEAFITGLRRPASVQFAEHALNAARKARASANDRAILAAAAFRVGGEGSSMRAVHSTELALAEADEFVRRARLKVNEAREAWRPSLLADFQPHRLAAERLLTAAMGDACSALAMLVKLTQLSSALGIDPGNFASRARAAAVERLYE